MLCQQDCHVHAFIYADNWKSLADIINEGAVYVVSNFYTKIPNGSLKPVSTPILINFSPSTVVEKVEEDDFMIPTHKFEFVDLSDLFSLASANANVEYPEFSTGFSLTINYTLDMHFSTINRITCFVFVISHMYSLLIFFYYLSKMLLVCLRILNTYQKLRLFMEKRI